MPTPSHSQPHGRQRRHQGGKHKTDQWQGANDAHHIGGECQLITNGRYKQAEGKTRQPVTDRNQRRAEKRKGRAGRSLHDTSAKLPLRMGAGYMY